MSKGAPQQPQAGGGGGGEALDFLWIMAGLIIAIMITWHYGKAYITQAIFAVRYYEIEVIKYFFAHWSNLAQRAQQLNLYLPIPNLTLLDTWQKFIIASKGAVPFSIILSLSKDVGSFLRYPMILILSILAFYLYKTSIAQKFKHVFNMQYLRKLEQKNWPQIAPIVDLNLLETPLDEGPWAMAMAPMQFCKKHQLLRIETDYNTGRPIATLLRGPAHNILTMQLGPRWKGIQFLPKYLQALFAAFISRINGDKKSADRLIEQLAKSAAKGQVDFSGVLRLLIKHYNTREVAKIISVHAYVTTIMASLLSASREAGVLATSEFLWLKPIDRRMWYMLNSVGRPTAVAEISGAFAHWLSERKLGIPLTTPMVEEAVNGLEASLREIIYKPEEEPLKKKKRKWFRSK